jgi:ATP-dependent protease HslVU (ClpYQ) peptidase subunit
MAGDLQLTISGTQITKCRTKIFKIDPNLDYFTEPFIVGFAGDAQEIIDVLDFFEHPELFPKPPRIKGTQGLVLTQSKKIFQFTNPTSWIEINDKFAAIGTGGTYALGALNTGASPKEAVNAACKLDPFSGQGVKTLKF